ncbi:LOW QUALITY PROTEIN: hypothetical protein HZS_1775 [Henneguya salminicola]|nr:LOW QUALITY PROTEIN: hypothetical protein HZS_1775 [Henneguya salminicola]
MYRKVWEKVRENVEIPCQTATCDFEKQFLYASQSEATIDWMFFPLQPMYMAPHSNWGGNKYYTGIRKERDQSLRYLRLLHLSKEIMLLERMKHWKSIYASIGLNNNSENS